MGTKNINPFILPGLGQTGAGSQNPLLASMDMMRQAWEGLARASGMDSTLSAPGMTPEDLERRIADLRTVEHWLQMNLTMLASAIQALEVQRSTISTLTSFFSSAASEAGSSGAFPSPFSFMPGQAASGEPDTPAPSAPPPVSTVPSGDSSGLFGPAPGGPTSASSASSGSAAADEAVAQASQRAQETMQGWWDMLQAQFDSLADATAASFKGAESMQQAAAAAQQQVMDSVQSTMAAGQQAAVGKTAAKKAGKKAAKKAAAKKTAAKKATARKAAGKAAKKAGRKAAGKHAAKKS